MQGKQYTAFYSLRRFVAAGGESGLQQMALFFLFFLTYSFLGWLCESIYCSIPARHWINRGFLTGPVCPVYGVGGVLIVLLLTPVKDNWILLYLLGVLVTSIVEYCTGFLLESLFHTRWWDYSQKKFNLQGRVCLKNSLLFGFLCVLLLRFVHPFIRNFFLRLPDAFLYGSAFLLACVFLTDTVFSIRAALQLSGKLQKIQGLLEEVRQKQTLRSREGHKLLRQSLEASELEARRRLQEFQQSAEASLHRLHRRLMRAFPSMHSSFGKDSISILRKVLEQKSPKRRKKTSRKRR